MTGTTIMLVDDEVPFVEAMTKRLVKRGFNVLTAHSGPEALEKLGQEEGSRVEVVILDVKMPGMDGQEALGHIKAKFPLVEVIMLTGHGTIEAAIDGMKRGAYDFLTKPAEMDVLTAKVNDAAAKKAAHEARIQEARAWAIVNRRGD